MKKIVVLSIALTLTYITGLQAQTDSNKTTGAKPDKKEITLVEYNKKIANTDRMVLVYFSASSCYACIKMKPLIEQAEQKFSESIEVLRIDADRDMEITDEFEIEALPALILYKNGINQWSYKGLLDEKLLDFKLEFYDRKKVWIK